MILPSHAYVGAAAVGTTAASYSAYKNKKIRTKPGAARAQRRLARPVVNGSMGAVGGGVQPLAMIAAKKTEEEKPKPTMKEILQKAGKRALGGGIPGAAAMVVQSRNCRQLTETAKRISMQCCSENRSQSADCNGQDAQKLWKRTYSSKSPISYAGRSRTNKQALRPSAL